MITVKHDLRYTSFFKCIFVDILNNIMQIWINLFEK